MSSRNYYQEIFDLVLPFLPESWQKVVLYAEFSEDSRCIEFYVKNADGTFTKCFNLLGVDDNELLDAFDEMGEVFEAQRQELPTGSVWTNATLTVTSTGRLAADFDYTDLSESSFEHKKEWKAEYLA